MFLYDSQGPVANQINSPQRQLAPFLGHKSQSSPTRVAIKGVIPVENKHFRSVDIRFDVTADKRSGSTSSLYGVEYSGGLLSLSRHSWTGSY